VLFDHNVKKNSKTKTDRYGKSMALSAGYAFIFKKENDGRVESGLLACILLSIWIVMTTDHRKEKTMKRMMLIPTCLLVLSGANALAEEVELRSQSPIRLERPFSITAGVTGAIDITGDEPDRPVLPLAQLQLEYNFSRWVSADFKLTSIIYATAAGAGSRVFFMSGAVSPYLAARLGVVHTLADGEDGASATNFFFEVGGGLDLALANGFTCNLEISTLVGGKGNKIGFLPLVSLGLGYRF
jgi:hypothetical protein